MLMASDRPTGAMASFQASLVVTTVGFSVGSRGLSRAPQVAGRSPVGGRRHVLLVLGSIFRTRAQSTRSHPVGGVSCGVWLTTTPCAGRIDRLRSLPVDRCPELHPPAACDYGRRSSILEHAPNSVLDEEHAHGIEVHLLGYGNGTLQAPTGSPPTSN